MITYLKPFFLEKLRIKLIRFLGGMATTPSFDYPYDKQLSEWSEKK